MSWLDSNADGVALMFWMFIGLIGLVLVGMLVEWLRAMPMRRRRRIREALTRYHQSIGAP